MALKKAMFRSLFEADPVWKSYVEVGSFYALAVGAIVVANTFNSWDGWTSRFMRISGTFAGMGLATYGLVRNREEVSLAQIFAARAQTRTKLVKQVGEEQIATFMNGIMQNNVQNNAAFQPEQFNREQLLDEATGIAILGNSGSGKTTLAQYLVQGIDAPILVLDPHGHTYEPNEFPWGNLIVIDNKADILKTMEWLLDLLDDGDKNPLTIIADEFPSIRDYAQEQSSIIADRFIVQYGSEARKFNKLAIFCSQSGNVKALGLGGRGDFLENFALIRLQKIAKKFTKNHKNQALHEWMKQAAYPMLIDGEYAFLHPNLGHHQRVFKGAKPTGLLPLDSSPILHKLPTHTTHTAPTDQHTLTNSQQWLKSKYSLDCVEPTHTPTHIQDAAECPQCGSPNTQGHGSYKGQPRKRCIDCNKTWTIKE